MTGRRWFPAYIGLGANLDDPPRQLRDALEAIAALRGVRLVTQSRFYANPPLGPQDQPEFVNAVAGILTWLAPQDLLRALQDIEHRQGRTRGTEHWGPRRLDLDLLVYADARIAEARLRVPHPGIAERVFVALPLAEIAPTLRIPGLGPAHALCARFDEKVLRALPTAAPAATAVA